ncbi:hypothetical protein [Zooshikella ganghwensis]|uniref:Uncharacterized protein n=1 Tax=Zooshikella ganghwensis TaxID=202772 RepID=A0A4P9VNY1_9GAMM|nr:hypothetical protein [Zooshikella ganghwensis]RDH44369.1 hypothetical protein B9G39_13460 [Zooshikella ganghwensis]
MKAKFFFQRLKNYRNIENDRQRKDEGEGLSQILQSTDTTVTINNEVIQTVGPIKVDEGTNNPFIYCIYAVTKHHIENRQIPTVHPSCKEFGDTAVVITKPNQFFSLISNNHLAGGITGKMVDYLDYQAHHGDIDPVFNKSNNYNHQSEYRIKIADRVNPNNTMTLKVGSLEECGFICKFSELNKKIKRKVTVNLVQA